MPAATMYTEAILLRDLSFVDSFGILPCVPDDTQNCSGSATSKKHWQQNLICEQSGRTV